MDRQVMAKLTAIEKMVGALMKHQGLIQWIDRYAVGANEGGRYVSLFNSRANFRICVVYEEQFGQLPPFVRESIPADCGGEISTERARLEQKGLLRECTPFCITRWKLNPNDEQDRWRFGAVLYVKQGGQKPAQETPTPAVPQVGGGSASSQPSVPPAPPAQSEGDDNPFADVQRPASPVAPHRCTPVQLERLEAVGLQLYGEAWETKRVQLVEHISSGAETEAASLTMSEAQTLIHGMVDRLGQRNGHGA